MYQSFTNLTIGSQQGVGDSRKGDGSKAPDTVASALLRGSKKWRLNPDNRKREAEKQKLYRIKNRDKIRLKDKGRHLKRTYGITMTQFEELFLRQNKKCAVCLRQLPDGFSLSKHIDHDHKTGKVRGVLCSKCNGLLGMANDQIETLRGAISYLRTHG